MAQEDNNRPKKSTGPDGMTPGEKKGMWATLVLGTLGIGTIIVAFYRDIMKPIPQAEQPKANLKAPREPEPKGKALEPKAPEPELSELEKNIKILKDAYDKFPERYRKGFEVNDDFSDLQNTGRKVVSLLTYDDDHEAALLGGKSAGGLLVTFTKDGKVFNSFLAPFPNPEKGKEIEEVHKDETRDLKEPFPRELMQRDVNRYADELYKMIGTRDDYDKLVGLLNKGPLALYNGGVKYPTSRELDAFRREEFQRRGILPKGEADLKGMGR